MLNTTKTYLLVWILFIIRTTSAFNVLILNDIHFNNTLSLSCRLGRCKDLGTYGKDSPVKLIKKVMDKAQEEFKYDVILVNGDFIFHSFFYGSKYGVSYG